MCVSNINLLFSFPSVDYITSPNGSMCVFAICRLVQAQPPRCSFYQMDFVVSSCFFYVIMKHAIFIHMVGVECINKILKSIYHCLDESNITPSLLSNFNPYADIDKMINVIVDGREPRHFDYNNLVPEEDPDLST